MRSHLRAGRSKRASMVSARSASVSRSGTAPSRSANTTVLPSFVGRRLRMRSMPKTEAMRDALRSKLEARPKRLTDITPPSPSSVQQSR